MKPFDSTKPVIHAEIAPLRLTYSSITTVAYLPSPNYGHGRLHGRPALPCALGRRIGDRCERSTESPGQRKRDSGSSRRLGCASQALAVSNRPRTAPEHGQYVPRSLSDLLLGKQRTKGHPAALRLLRRASYRSRTWAKLQPAAVSGDEWGVAAFHDASDTSEDGALGMTAHTKITT